MDVEILMKTPENQKFEIYVHQNLVPDNLKILNPSALFMYEDLGAI